MLLILRERMPECCEYCFYTLQSLPVTVEESWTWRWEVRVAEILMLEWLVTRVRTLSSSPECLLTTSSAPETPDNWELINDVNDTDLVLGPRQLPSQRLSLLLILLDDGQQHGQLLVDCHRDLYQPLTLGHDPLLLGNEWRRQFLLLCSQTHGLHGLLLWQLECLVDEWCESLGLTQRWQQNLRCWPVTCSPALYTVVAVLSDTLQLLVRNVEDLLDQFLLILQSPGHLLVLPPQLFNRSHHRLSQEDLLTGVDHDLTGVDQLSSKYLSLFIYLSE